MVGKIESIAFRPIDDRQYALVRIAFAVVAMFNLVQLWTLRHSLLAENGVIGRSIEHWYEYLSVFTYVQSGPAVSAYLIFMAVLIVLLGLGILPRIAILGVFVWQASYGIQLAHSAYGADSVMRAFVFLVLISPLGYSWSWNAWRSDEKRERAYAPFYGIVLMRLQLAVIYFETGIVKVISEYWQNGETFAYYMLSVYSRFKTPLLADWTWLSKTLTYGTLTLELLLPVLLFVPKTRLFAICLGVSLHVAIAVTSHHLLLFSLTMIPGYLAFLDLQYVDRVISWWRKRQA